MAKSQVTEDDIAQGIQSLGGFGGLSGQKPRRDSPFGSDFAAKKDLKPSPAPAVVENRAPAIATPSPIITAEPLAKKVEVLSPPKEESAPASVPIKVSPVKKAISKPIDESREGHPKSDECTERITLQMTPEMRDELNELARGLQRGRREKGERITANTLMRVAIQSFIDSFDAKVLGGVSSEEELFQEMKMARKVKS